VDKIFGPGNRYVTRAKQLVAGDTVAVDLPAGPSEVLVLLDDDASRAFAAADLLSQAEHGGTVRRCWSAPPKTFARRVQTRRRRAIGSDLGRGTVIREGTPNEPDRGARRPGGAHRLRRRLRPRAPDSCDARPVGAAGRIAAGKRVVGPWRPWFRGGFNPSRSPV